MRRPQPGGTVSDGIWLGMFVYVVEAIKGAAEVLRMPDTAPSGGAGILGCRTFPLDAFRHRS
jgi:hypothetical protein